MTPAGGMELPVKAGEAAVLAELIFEHTEGRALDDRLRGRLAGRIAALGLTSMQPLSGSLQRDPIHPATFYLMVEPAAAPPVLLRLALASSPSSGLFPNAMLIGRMRTDSNREVVVNAIRFDQTDREPIQTFATKVDRAFLPRSGAGLPGILTRVGNASELWHATVWEAIRVGRRAGWTATISLDPAEDGEAALPGLPEFTCLSIRLGEVTERALAGCEPYYALLRPSMQFELDLTGVSTATTPEDVAGCLSHFRALGQPVHSVAVHLADREALPALVEAARAWNAVIRVNGHPDGKLAGVRVQYRGTGEVPKFL